MASSKSDDIPIERVSKLAEGPRISSKRRRSSANDSPILRVSSVRGPTVIRPRGRNRGRFASASRHARSSSRDAKPDFVCSPLVFSSSRTSMDLSRSAHRVSSACATCRLSTDWTQAKMPCGRPGLVRLQVTNKVQLKGPIQAGELRLCLLDTVFSKEQRPGRQGSLPPARAESPSSLP